MQEKASRAAAARNHPRGAGRVAQASARLCGLIRDQLAAELGAGDGPLVRVTKRWRKVHLPAASDVEFADGFAQAVTFAVLLEGAQDRAAGSTILGAALRAFAHSGYGGEIALALGELQRVLGRVDWPRTDTGEAWLDVYEEFSAVYDGSARKRNGFYVTEPELVSAIVGLADEVVRNRFALPHGLASDGVALVDPAAGTGSFALGVIRSIARSVARNQGLPAVPSAILAAARRLVAFELQLGPFAVAELRLLRELRQLTGTAPTSIPGLCLADTLASPAADPQRWAAPRITVVLGNPPYRDKAKALGGFIVRGDGGRGALLDAWIAPAEWRLGAQTRHLHNLYVYFWRWATWQVFERPPGTGLVCFVSSAAFLSGAAFEKMRDYLRRMTEEIWVVDCSPDGHQAQTNTRLFANVQRSVCLVLAYRSLRTDERTPATVHWRALPKGRRETKLRALEQTQLDDRRQWEDCPQAWRAPFRPVANPAWPTYWPLESLFVYHGNGSMIGRTWVVAPDPQSLRRRWKALTTARSDEKAALFQPHTRHGRPGDRHVHKLLRDGLAGFESRSCAVADDHGPCMAPVPYGFRSFDRQYIIPDRRLINVPNQTLWGAYSEQQVFLTAPMDRRPTAGPALTVTGLVPDVHHYAGRGGRVFMLWRDRAAVVTNVHPDLLRTLTRQYQRPVTASEVFAYVVAVASQPAFTARFAMEMSSPGIRIPFTTEVRLFLQTVAIGRTVVWLQTFGERYVDAAEGRPRMPPVIRGEAARVVSGGAGDGARGLPRRMYYDVASQRLYFGGGYVEGVPQAVWRYRVSGMRVLRQWFSYRTGDRMRPAHGRQSSALAEVVPARWPRPYTTELLRLVQVLGRLIELEPLQSELLDRICTGRTFPFDRLWPDER